MRRRPLPPALRTVINRLAHEQAIQWERCQRDTLTRQAQGLWGAGAGLDAIEAKLRQADAVERPEGHSVPDWENRPGVSIEHQAPKKKISPDRHPARATRHPAAPRGWKQRRQTRPGSVNSDG